MNTPRIVIVGAGFAGLLTAKRLAKRARKNADVLLINQTAHFTFLPRLVDVLQDRFEHVPFRGDLHALAKKYGFRFVEATVDAVDRDTRHARIIGTDGNIESIPYDYIVIAPGATTNYYHTPGAREYTIDLKSFESVVAIRQRVVALFAQAAEAADDAERRRLLSVAVIGGGGAGIEALFGLKLHVEKYAETHAPELKKFISFILVQAAPQILPGFPDALVDGASTEMLRHGISLFIGEPVIRVTEHGLETIHGRTIPAGLMLWCAGLAAAPLTITPAPAVDAAGFIVTDRSLRVDDHLFAAGDAISFRDQQMLVPKNGQTARRMAFTVEENIRRSIAGKPLVHFHYFSKGTLLIVGKTGFLDLHSLVIKSRLIIHLRDLFYRLIYKEIST